MEAAAYNSQVCQLAMLPHTLGSQMLLSCQLRTSSPGGNPQLSGWTLKSTRTSEKRGGTELNLNKECSYDSTWFVVVFSVLVWSFFGVCVWGFLFAFFFVWFFFGGFIWLIRDLFVTFFKTSLHFFNIISVLVSQSLSYLSLVAPGNTFGGRDSSSVIGTWVCLMRRGPW